MTRWTPQQVADAWRRHSTQIPVTYAVGTVTRESGFDPLCNTPEGNGTRSLGLYQVNAQEAAQVGFADADLLDGEACTQVFARLQEGRIPSLTIYGNREPDLWAFLGIAHNQGVGAAQKTLASYGMDWVAYKERNGVKHPNWSRYGDSCIDGGERFGEVTGGDAGPFPLSDILGDWFDFRTDEPVSSTSDVALPFIAALGAAVLYSLS